MCVIVWLITAGTKTPQTYSLRRGCIFSPGGLSLVAFRLVHFTWLVLPILPRHSPFSLSESLYGMFSDSCLMETVFGLVRYQLRTSITMSRDCSQSTHVRQRGAPARPLARPVAPAVHRRIRCHSMLGLGVSLPCGIRETGRVLGNNASLEASRRCTEVRLLCGTF